MSRFPLYLIGCALLLSPLAVLADGNGNPCVENWECTGVTAAPVIRVHVVNEGSYSGYPGDTVNVVFGYTVEPGSKTETDTVCNKGDRTVGISGAPTSGATQTVPVTLTTAPWSPGTSVAYAGSPAATGTYEGCDGTVNINLASSQATGYINILKPECDERTEEKWEDVDGETTEVEIAERVVLARCNDGKTKRDAKGYEIYQAQGQWIRTVYYGSTGCPSPTEWERNANRGVRQGAYLRTDLRDHIDYDCVSSPGPGPGPDPTPEPGEEEEQECEEASDSNHGEAFVSGEVETDDPNQTMVVIPLPTPVAEDAPPRQFIVTVGHRIVTHNTPRERDLSGALKLKLPAGGTLSDAITVEIAVRNEDGDFVYDAAGEQIYVPYSVGSGVSILEKGHSGCGIHDYHEGLEIFRFTVHRNEPMVLIAEADPSSEAEGDGVPLKRVMIKFIYVTLDSPAAAAGSFFGSGTGERRIRKVYLRNPQGFHRTDDPVYLPTDTLSIEPALVVFRDDVEKPDGTILDFNFNLKVAGVDTTDPVIWEKKTGPSSGTLTDESMTSAIYVNPKVPGLYQFNLSFLNAEIRTYAILPMAGADISDWLQGEVESVDSWAVVHRINTEDANYSPIPLVTTVQVFRTWVTISARDFDYVIDSVDSDELSPTRRYQSDIDTDGVYGYTTVEGIVLHGSKVNLMLWSIFGHGWGFSHWQLLAGSAYNNRKVKSEMDDDSARYAIGLGSTLYAHDDLDLSDEWVKLALKRMQAFPDLIEEKLWPSPYPADFSRSRLIRPTLTTTP